MPKAGIRKQDRKIDKGKALILKTKGLSNREIGKHFGTTGSAVQKALKPITDIVLNPEQLREYRDKQVDVLDSAGYEFLSSALSPDTIKKSSTLQLISSFGILFDKTRLLQGKSLNNIDVHVESVEVGKLDQSKRELMEKLESLKGIPQDVVSEAKMADSDK